MEIEKENTYFVGQSPSEASRLENQDHLLNMQGLLTPLTAQEQSQLKDVLDLACGAGVWGSEVAQTLPDCQVLCTDADADIVEYARTTAEFRDLSNISFQIMNALKPFPFEDNSFDLVNARFINGFLMKDDWPVMLREIHRVVRPGGLIRLTEYEMGISNGPVSEKLTNIYLQAWRQAGRSFSPGGRTLGLLPVMPRLLAEAGFKNFRREPHLVDYSYGEEAHEAWVQNLKVLYKLGQGFLTKVTKVISEDEMNRLYDEVVAEMDTESFSAIWIFITVVGQKALE
ncbi:MAG TPA: methyltransferase domain-containing protein [Ktedonobacteraceae bacterium]|nr:methyltransferase domain-containing protein [Ktedonobacteraceae bacterium]